MKMKSLLETFTMAALCATQTIAAPMSTAFTYQGRLNDGGAPANAKYDMIFNLYDAPTNGNVFGTFSIFGGVPVSNGVFTVELNAYGEFGTNAFNGEARWLQIGVRTNSNNAFNNFVFLSPRQPLNCAPEALFALNAGKALSVADGSITSSKLANGAVAWTNITGRPAPYTAGTGLSLNGSEFSVNFGTNGVATTAARSDHRHFGEEWTGSSDNAGLSVINAEQNGVGLHGRATSVTGSSAGVYGLSTSPEGYGVLGAATATNGANYGVYGQSDSVQGIAIFGRATSTTGVTAGLAGESDAPGGYGVVGFNTSTNGTNYGVVGQCDSPQGYGVYGYSRAEFGATYGVFGKSDSTYGYGVVGKAAATSGMNYGVLGESASSQGAGVFGKATSANGWNYGVRGETASSGGRAVFGVATAASGSTIGVSGESSSSGGQGVTGLATATLGITAGVAGQANSTSGVGVRGLATAGSGATVGVRGEAYSAQGVGVLARNDNGVAFKAAGTGIIQSDADSVIWIPGCAGIGFWSDDAVKRYGTSLMVGDRGFNDNSVLYPLTLPAVLYGQSTAVKSIEIRYSCSNGTNGFITKTTVLSNGVTLLNDAVQRRSNSNATYTLTLNPPFISTSGFLVLNFECELHQEVVWIHGIKVRLGHD